MSTINLSPPVLERQESSYIGITDQDKEKLLQGVKWNDLVKQNFERYNEQLQNASSKKVSRDTSDIVEVVKVKGYLQK